MKCTRQPRFLQGKTIQIANILEVQLAPIQWNSIERTASVYGATYSTITRYCVLKLAQKCALRWSPRFDRASARVRHGISIATGMHRHMLCLYGDDEKIIRLAAMDLGITMSAFVRLALELYLDALAMEKRSYKKPVSAALLKEGGIRFTESIQIFAVNGGPWPFSRHLSCIPFAIDSYW